MIHPQFQTTSRGLNRQSPPMRLFEKAKRLGIWNPSEIDLTQDQRDWQGLDKMQQSAILRLTAMFQAGEEAVTLDLLPLIEVIASEGRLEEEMFLTTFLWEEAKHTDFFRRFLDEVAGGILDLGHFHTANYHTVFYEALPQAMARLKTDPSPEAQVQASVTYNMIVEGVLAETGYQSFHAMLERNHLMPGVQKGISLLKQDESRHIAYGVYLLSRLISADDCLWQVFEDTMNRLFTPAIGVVSDSFLAFDESPFGLQIQDFVDYATHQYQKRYERLEKARGASLEEIDRETHRVIDENDG